MPELELNPTLRVDDEGHRIGDAEGVVLRVGIDGIADAKGVDRNRGRVCEEGQGNIPPVRKHRQRLHLVIGDDGDRVAAGLEGVQGRLDFNDLGLTERAPVERAIEIENQPVFTGQVRQVAPLARCIHKRDRRDGRADSRTQIDHRLFSGLEGLRLPAARSEGQAGQNAGEKCVARQSGFCLTQARGRGPCMRSPVPARRRQRRQTSPFRRH